MRSTRLAFAVTCFFVATAGCRREAPAQQEVALRLNIDFKRSATLAAWQNESINTRGAVVALESCEAVEQLVASLGMEVAPRGDSENWLDRFRERFGKRFEGLIVNGSRVYVLRPGQTNDSYITISPRGSICFIEMYTPSGR
jgi:hypothetical protein